MKCSLRLTGTKLKCLNENENELDEEWEGSIGRFLIRAKKEKLGLRIKL